MLFSALFSGCEMAFVKGDRVRVELDSERGGIVGKIIRRFYSNSELYISTILVGNNIMLVIFGMGMAKLLDPLIEKICQNEAFILTVQTIISTVIIIFTGEFFPKITFGINPNSSLKIFAIPIYCFYIVLYPISMFTAWISKKLMKVAGIENEAKPVHLITIGDLNEYVEDTIDELEENRQPVENEVKIFRNALDFSDTHVRDCMTPRNEIVAINIDTATRDSLAALFTSSGRSKIIVYRDDIDTILGYIHVSELFDPSKDWHEHIKPVLYAPENLLANTMMKRLLQQKRSIAIVVDEFGGTAGMLTLEDLMEEIYGNIEDEHDRSRLIARKSSDGTYLLSGRCEIAQINETFGLDLPEDDAYQTLAGYILHATGVIPAQGHSVDIDNRRFDILKKSATRIELVRLTVLPPEKE